VNLTNRTLILIRHAQSLSTQHDKSDKERELNEEGIRDAKAIGKFLSTLNLCDYQLVSSDATRAITTSKCIATQVNYPQYDIYLDSDIYSGTMEDILYLIQNTPDDIHTLIIVGHNPAISEMHNYISVSNKIIMQPGELAIIQINTPWNKTITGCGRTLLHYHPSQTTVHGKL
jgi:phosphohistidine phosphatase